MKKSSKPSTKKRRGTSRAPRQRGGKETLVALFEGSEHAREAVKALQKANFGPEQLGIAAFRVSLTRKLVKTTKVSVSRNAVVRVLADRQTEQLTRLLDEIGVAEPEKEAATAEQTFHAGGPVITIAPGLRHSRALRLLSELPGSPTTVFDIKGLNEPNAFFSRNREPVAELPGPPITKID